MVDVQVSCSGDGHDRWLLAWERLRQKLFDFLVVFPGLNVIDQIYLIFRNDHRLTWPNCDGLQMLNGLRLWARLLRSNKQESHIHQTDAGQHSSHKVIVAWAVYDGYMTNQFCRFVASGAWAVVPSIKFSSEVPLVLRDALRIRAFEYFCIRISQLNGDIVHLLARKLYCVDICQRSG